MVSTTKDRSPLPQSWACTDPRDVVTKYLRIPAPVMPLADRFDQRRPRGGEP